MHCGQSIYHIVHGTEYCQTYSISGKQNSDGKLLNQYINKQIVRNMQKDNAKLLRRPAQ